MFISQYRSGVAFDNEYYSALSGGKMICRQTSSSKHPCVYLGTLHTHVSHVHHPIYYTPPIVSREVCWVGNTAPVFCY